MPSLPGEAHVVLRVACRLQCTLGLSPAPPTTTMLLPASQFGDGSSPPGWSLSSGKAHGVLWGPRPPVLSALHGLGPPCLGSTPFSVWPKSVSSAILTSLWTFFPSRSFPLETCFCLYHVSMITDRRQAPSLQKGPPLDGVENGSLLSSRHTALRPRGWVTSAGFSLGA